MLERLLFVLVLLALGYVLIRLVQRWQIKRITPTDPLLAGLSPDYLTIVYFTTPGCATCKTAQQPALQRLQQALADRLQIVQVDASEHPDVASRWGVQTAPTTFVLDRTGKPIAINNGFADEALLRKQLNIA